MTTKTKCAHCREEMTEEPIEVNGKVYCCEACAFEASQRTCCTCGRVCTTASGSRYKPNK
ncbi:MAG: metallothionein [Chloroflexota bacterium]